VWQRDHSGDDDEVARRGVLALHRLRPRVAWRYERFPSAALGVFCRKRRAATRMFQMRIGQCWTGHRHVVLHLFPLPPLRRNLGLSRSSSRAANIGQRTNATQDRQALIRQPPLAAMRHVLRCCPSMADKPTALNCPRCGLPLHCIEILESPEHSTFYICKCASDGLFHFSDRTDLAPGPPPHLLA